jgi:hypothetical protein
VERQGSTVRQLPSAGGTRAIEDLRLVMGELHVADVRNQVALSLFTARASPSSARRAPLRGGGLAAGRRPLYQALYSAFPDFCAAIGWQSVEADVVRTYKTDSGTHDGESVGLARPAGTLSSRPSMRCV